ncbi:hypothetical protein [Streptomyces sp. NPDC093149]|uniref:hypothetical protein n=1 Tax=Streptomyces sp. NPDC093149 TaxID=3366031 RepID=UPI0038023770
METTEAAPADEDDADSGFRNIGCQIVCSPDVAGEIAQWLRDVVGEILDDYADDVFDCPLHQGKGSPHVRPHRLAPRVRVATRPARRCR